MPTKLSLVAVLALVMASTGASLATADGSDDNGSTQVIRLVSKPVQETELDLGDKGFGPGDQFVFADDLFRDGKKVGQDGGSCTVVRLDAAAPTVNCAATLSLPKGQVTVQGLVTFAGEPEDPEPFVVAITGGTGAYRTAGGELEVDEEPDHDNLTLRLIL